MNKENIKKQIEENPDAIFCIKHSNSISILIDKHPEGIDDDFISRVLMIPVEEVRERYKNALKFLRERLEDEHEKS